ncbi:PPOX class F420-dependent oxidoreductase [Intrasporangium sp. DVR]|uniref:PPOX class F420-dependent oxidoreductase n=1 Tax=Intrasporangium sp. DVR TaxID=3127867 RepID=UPI00313A7202
MEPDLSRRLDEIAAHRYLSVTTFRRSGQPVATPMWVARSGDAVVLISVDGQGKTRRLAHTRRVELRPCDVRGRVAADAPVWHGTATLVRDPRGVDEVRRAMSAKYPLARIGNVAEDLLGRFMQRKPRVGIRVTPVTPRASA